jgi:hypothetical protein
MSLIKRYPRTSGLFVVLLLAALTMSVLAPAVLGQAAPARTEQNRESAASDVSCPGRADPFIRTELFFGSNKPDGTVVTEQEFLSFLSQVITPRFPDGLTLLTGLGQFRNSSGTIIRERSMLLILLYPRETARKSSERIEEIRTAYVQQFQQESVLRADDRLPQCVSF